MSTATAAAQPVADHRGLFDPYRLDPANVVDPPVGLISILRRIGPGLVLSASIVGSGELIATTTLGARLGYTMMWLIIISCLIKAVVQAVLGRYIIASGETTLTAFARIPGPRFIVNWVVWCWFAATVAVLFALTGMYIGVSQVMNSLFPAVSVTAWVLIFMVTTLALLLGGAYPRIEKIAMFKVGVFTVITCLAAVVLTRMPEFFSWGQIVEGLKFTMPEGEGLAVAIAVFGITGVASGELCIYPYWCIEKGYARFTGPREATDDWRRRARGWIRVMHVDVVVSMIVYTLATIAFYLLGAGILHGMGQVPDGKNMISALSNIYTQTLGPWSLWLFYFGAVMILYGTVFAVTAGNSRMLADFSQQFGAFARDDYRRRSRIRDIYILIITVLAVSLYFVFGQAPVTLVVWTGIGQAALLPIVAFGTVFLAARHLAPELKVPGWLMVMLWLAAIVIAGFIVPSLYLEFVKMF